VVVLESIRGVDDNSIRFGEKVQTHGIPSLLGKSNRPGWGER